MPRRCGRPDTCSSARPTAFGLWIQCRRNFFGRRDRDPLPRSLLMLPIQHPHEPDSNAARETITRVEPRSLRTFTPTQAVLARSAGVYHWTPEGRRLYDFSSGVLVANLGHNPSSWMRRFSDYMGWPAAACKDEFFPALPLTAYN